MQTVILRTIKFSLGGFVLVGILGNSGCLVDTGSDVTDPSPMTQKHLRIYKPGNEIKYDLRFDVHQGTLKTKWQLPGPDETVDAEPWTAGIEPIPGLLKETTTLEHDGIDEPVVVVRYITQDSEPSSPTYGSITVHAIHSQSGPPYFDYVHDSVSLPSDAIPNPVVIMPSPLLDGNLEPITEQDIPISYHVFRCNIDPNEHNCSTTEDQNYTETLERTKAVKENLETSLNYFETVKVPFSSGQVNDLDFNEPNVRLDIKAWCGDITAQAIIFSGKQWFYPSIGVVRYEISCNGVNVYANITSANFSY